METPEHEAAWVATVGSLDPKFCFKSLPKKYAKSEENGKFSFSEECLIINIESIMDVENYGFSFPSIIFDPGRSHQWILKSVR